MTPYCDRDRREDQRPRRSDGSERAKGIEGVEVFEFSRLETHRMAFALGAFVALLGFVGPGFGISTSGFGIGAFGNHANNNLIVLRIARSHSQQVRFEKA